MKDVTPRERWEVWMHQAQRFADRENYIDALGRARMVLREVTEALETGDLDEKDAQRLKRFAARVERRMIAHASCPWIASIAARASGMASVMPRSLRLRRRSSGAASRA